MFRHPLYGQPLVLQSQVLFTTVSEPENIESVLEGYDNY